MFCQVIPTADMAGKKQSKSVSRNSIGLDSRTTGFDLQQTIRLIQSLADEIAVLDKEIKKIMKECAIIISEIGDIENFQNPAKLLAFSGLEPSTYQS